MKIAGGGFELLYHFAVVYYQRLDDFGGEDHLPYVEF